MLFTDSSDCAIWMKLKHTVRVLHWTQHQFVIVTYFFSIVSSKFSAAQHLSNQMTAFTFQAEEKKSILRPVNSICRYSSCIRFMIIGWKMPMRRYTQLILADWNVITVSLVLVRVQNRKFANFEKLPKRKPKNGILVKWKTAAK